MKYAENIEPLSDEEKRTQKRDFFFVVVFYIFFVSVFIFIVSSFEHSDGGDIFLYVILTFIGGVALLIFITLLRDFLTHEKIVQRGTITNKEIVKGQEQNSQKQFYIYFDSKEVSVSFSIFTEYAVGDTIEISRTRYSKNIIGAKILVKRDSVVIEENERAHIHSHSPRRSALQFDRQEILEREERKFLLRQFFFSLMKRLPLLFIIWISTPLVLLFLTKTVLFRQINTFIPVDFALVKICCLIVVGTFILKRPLLICIDIYKNEKLVLYKTANTILKRYIHSINGIMVTEVVFDDGKKEKVQADFSKRIEANMLLEIHKTIYSKIIVKTNIIE